MILSGDGEERVSTVVLFRDPEYDVLVRRFPRMIVACMHTRQSPAARCALALSIPLDHQHRIASHRYRLPIELLQLNYIYLNINSQDSMYEYPHTKENTHYYKYKTF